MKLIISNTNGIPIYIQIKQQIINAVLTGELQDNEQLPSLRQLSKELMVSVLTTTRAYTELEQEGFIETVQGKGCFVVPKGSLKVKNQLCGKINENLSEAVRLSKRIDMSSENLLEMLRRVLESESGE